MAQARKFPIVGVGASAGGVEALEGFFQGIPPDPGIGVVVITHLNPQRESLLHEIIGRYTDLPVHVAQDGAEVAPNSVHVLPADGILSIKDGRLAIRKQTPTQPERKPIDLFLSSLAKDQGEYAVSVVLSGGDGDGALGTKAVKERGGLTLAQASDGHGPSHPDMPESAISTGLVDFALPADKMGARLADYARNFDALDDIASADGSDKAAVDAARAEIYALLRNEVGHDFGGYKPRTFLRRVQRRMQVAQLKSLEAYVQQLRRDPVELNALFRDLLINVTTFFRDGESFEKLAELVIPKLFEGRGATDTVRVWVPGCATGEEVFSIAMLMREHMDRLSAVPRVNIFATDIDEAALGAARSGRYPEALLDSVSKERRERFFVADGGSFVLRKEVREMCIFSPHSVIRDPPFSRMDLVSCRNLLIYFGPNVQSQVIPTFHYSLKPGGYLFLGGSENTSQFSDLFAPLDKKHRLFRAREGIGGRPPLPLTVGGLRVGALAHSGVSAIRPAAGGMALRQIVEQQVLDRFTPAHVVATRDGEVIYYSSHTGKYLESPPGAPSRQLLSLARRGLRLELRAVFREAIERNATAVRERVEVEADDGRIQLVKLTVEPVRQAGEEEPLLIVLFADEGAPLSREAVAGLSESRRLGATEVMEVELRDTRDRLQSLIEEYETALEELKASNEELVSVNEELQSTNEELEASKEELQSLNEELHTVNAELTGKVDELDRANADLQNLFESTKIGTVFLDSTLAIRSFTPSVSEVFNILPSDRGRPITDLSSRVQMPELGVDVRTVLREGRVIERRTTSYDRKHHFLVRIAPYLNSDQKQKGVVVSFANVTVIAEAEAHQQVLIDELNHRVKNMLMVAISMLEQTARSTSPEEFKEVFRGRLYAMASAYELVARESWTEVPISALVRRQLEPLGADRFVCTGPEVPLNPRQALGLGMILHELATNAAKYGAISASKGKVEIDWSVADQRLHLTWRESDGPAVSEPTRTGLGMRLIEREAASGLDGDINMAFQPSGLRVELTMRLDMASVPPKAFAPA